MPDKTFPFVGRPNQRATGTTDRRFVNCVIETVPDPTSKTQEVYVTKRDCLANFLQPSGGATTGRGIYHWPAIGSTFSVFNNVIYAGTSTMATMNTSTGRAWFVETPKEVSERLLIISDGLDNYNVSTDGVVIQVDENDHTSYPVSNLGPVLYLDSYLLQGQSSGRVVNSQLNSFSSWPGDGWLRAARRGDDLECIHLQKEQVIAFGKNSMEFYYDAGNSPGSPLQRIEQNAKDFGMAAKETLAWAGGTAMFVGDNPAQGEGRKVWILQEASRLADVSDDALNKLLDAEGASISSASALMFPMKGQVLYVLNLRKADRSFVYNTNNNTWTEFESSSGGRFPGVSATSVNGTVYIQGESDGRIYTLSASTFQDSGTTISTTIQTQRMSFGTNREKTETELSILGDQTLGTLSTSWSDDDFSTFTAPVGIDMATPDKRITRLGGFKERAYRFVYASNSSLRLQGHRHMWEEGRG